jgi:hypothetical protein
MAKKLSENQMQRSLGQKIIPNVQEPEHSKNAGSSSETRLDAGWQEEKMKHDLVILNNYVRPSPVFKTKSSKHSSDGESFKTLYLKMLGLSNMINLMNISAHVKAFGNI